MPNATIPLGLESDRFASRVALDEKFASRNRRAYAWTSFAATDQPEEVSAYQQIIDRTWGENDELPNFPIRDYREILDFLDDAPPVTRAYVGRWLTDQRHQLLHVGQIISGTTLIVDRPLIYMVDRVENCPDRAKWIAQLWGLTAARAIEWKAQMRSTVNTLGVGVRTIASGLDEYSYVLVKPDISLSNEMVRQTQWIFGTANFRTFRTGILTVGRNERCPCGSTKKFKQCHGRPASH
ncbi:SEC-C domain-containing protein [Nocardia sp. CA2R105]|nr:SEC-C domain-containing protein [Nocardia coffeae]